MIRSIGDHVVGEPPLDPLRKGDDQPEDDTLLRHVPNLRRLHRDATVMMAATESTEMRVGKDDGHPVWAEGRHNFLFAAEQTGWILHDLDHRRLPSREWTMDP